MNWSLVQKKKSWNYMWGWRDEVEGPAWLPVLGRHTFFIGPLFCRVPSVTLPRRVTDMEPRLTEAKRPVASHSQQREEKCRDLAFYPPEPPRALLRNQPWIPWEL